MLSFSGLGGLRASSLEAQGLYDTKLNTLSAQTPRGQELLGHIKKEWQIHKPINYMRNPKLAHIIFSLGSHFVNL